MAAHLDHRGVFVPGLHAQYRIDRSQRRPVVTAAGQEFAQVNAELNEAGAEPVALGCSPVRFGDLTEEIAAVQLQGLLRQLDSLAGLPRAETARGVRRQLVEFLDVHPDGHLAIDAVPAAVTDYERATWVDDPQGTAQFIDRLMQPVAPPVLVRLRPDGRDQLVPQHVAVTMGYQELHHRLRPLTPPVGYPASVQGELENAEHPYGDAARCVTARPRYGKAARARPARAHRGGCHPRRLDELVQQIQGILQPGERPGFAAGRLLVLRLELSQPASKPLPLSQRPAARGHRAGQRLVMSLRRALLHLPERAVGRLRGEPVAPRSPRLPFVVLLCHRHGRPTQLTAINPGWSGRRGGVPAP